ncbi:STAS/SEC14 domain-containing protein [Maricaulis sp.]|uniref:STAS/SEC14 domain-containing protein n=1 Tax=Maricaulis sp. TaxID=1486257 RepID=UPI002616F16B|nr:STAS/SEC14 domain-containing protein [Maricaulis sp.]
MLNAYSDQITTEKRLDDALLVQTITGRTDGVLVNTATAQLADAVEKGGVSRVLMNVAKSDAVFTPAEFIAMFQGFTARFPQIRRVAYVLDPQTHDVQQMLLEALAWNIGLDVFFAETLAEAETWIMR